MSISQKKPVKLFIQMSGAPGSGKSTVAQRLQSRIEGEIVDHDAIRSQIIESDIASFDKAAEKAYIEQWAQAENIMKQRINIIIDSTCNYQQVLDRGSELADKHGYDYWYVECNLNDIDLLDERLRLRSATAMASQRTAVDTPPAAARDSRAGEDARALFQKWIESPCRPDNHAIVIIVDSRGDPEKLCEEIMDMIFTANADDPEAISV